MTATKFYYYNIWIEDEAGRRLNPRRILSDDALSEELYEITQKGSKRYTCQFDFIRSFEYYGVLIRTKDESGYVRLNEDSDITTLAEATEDEGATGDVDFDYVDFGLQINDKSIDVLIEVGFQTPGIGIITKYLDQHINKDKIKQDQDFRQSDDSKNPYSIEYDTRFSSPAEEKLKRLLDSELKRVSVSFKKHPKMYESADMEQTLESLIPDNYRLEFGISLHRGKDLKKANGRDFLKKLFTSTFGMNNDTIEQSITKIDFPKIMNTFRIVGIEGEEEIEENLADDVMKEEIDTSRYGVYDSDLGKELCQHLRRVE